MCVERFRDHIKRGWRGYEWRMIEGETNPWYSTERLFRQPKPGDWDSVLMRVAAELGAFKQ